MSVTAQLDLTGSVPDSNGLEEALCPFHDTRQATLVLDYMRNAFLCMRCRRTGPFSIQQVAGKRIAVIEVDAYRALPNGATEQPSAGDVAQQLIVSGVNLKVIVAGKHFDLTRENLTTAAKNIDAPLVLLCAQQSLTEGLVAWINAVSPRTNIVIVPEQMLKDPASWALYGRTKAIVSP